MNEIETALISAALTESRGILKRAAQTLRIDRKTLSAKIKRTPDLAQLAKRPVSDAPSP